MPDPWSLTQAEMIRLGIVAKSPTETHVTGSAPPANMVPLDNTILNFMKANGVRNGQFAVAKEGLVLLNRAYTNAEPGAFIAEPHTLFRLASVSKAFTCAAIQHLRDQAARAKNDLFMSEKVFPMLGITKLANQNPHPLIDTIKIQHLVDHAGGWNHTVSGFDAVFSLRKIATALGMSRPPTKYDVARHMYGQPLQFDPGTQNFSTTNGNSYSNLGYVLLGLVVEAKSGVPFIDYLRDNVLKPDGITSVHLARMFPGSIQGNEPPYDDPGIGPSAFTPASSFTAPFPYGGEGYITEIMDSDGGLVATAQAVVMFIHRHAVWGMGGRAAGFSRAGSMAGTSSFAKSRPGGVDWCYIFNTRHFTTSGKPLDTLNSQIDAKLDIAKL